MAGFTDLTGGLSMLDIVRLGQLYDVSITAAVNGQVLTYQDGQWVNADGASDAVWGSITGTLSDQVDLQSALDAKISSITAGSNVTVDDTDPANPILATVSDPTFSTEVNTPITKATTSAGGELQTSNGTVALHYGAGAGANGTLYGGWNYDNATANTIASFGASKTITSLSTSTYPNLTELSYVKGVTSAIQTQLDGKQATLVSGTNIKTINSTSLLGSGDIAISASPAGSDTQLQFNDGGAFGASSKFTVDKTNGKIRISGVQSPTIELYTSLAGSSDRNWSITTTQGVNGNFVINKSTTAGGDPANNPAFALDQYGSLQVGTNSSFTYPSPLPVESKSINLKSSSSAYGTGIFSRRGGDEATGFNIWEYGGNFYIDSHYNDNGSNLYFRVKTAGTPVTAMTIKGSGYIGVGTTSPTTSLDINSDKVRVRTAKTPSSASDTGDQGDIAWDSNYLYVCTATNTWKRTALATW